MNSAAKTLGGTACGHAYLLKAESRVSLLFFLNWREQTSPDTQGWQWLCFTHCWEELGHAAGKGITCTNHYMHEQLMQAVAVRDSTAWLNRQELLHDLPRDGNAGVAQD